MSNALTTNSVWTHHRGENYRVVSLSNAESTRPGFEPRVEYRRIDEHDVEFGPLYSRRRDEFLQKFAPREIQYSSGRPPCSGRYACRVPDTSGYTLDEFLNFDSKTDRWYRTDCVTYETENVRWIGPLSREKLMFISEHIPQ